MKTSYATLALVLSAGLTAPALAAFNDPWYGFYRSKGGLQISVGPFNDKFKCEAARYNIPYDATWMGCFQ